MATNEKHSALATREGDDVVQGDAGLDRGATMNEHTNTDAVTVQHENGTGHNSEFPSSRSSTTANATPADVDVTNKEEVVPLNPEASRTKLQTSIIMAGLMASVFLAALDITIITTAYVYPL